MLFCVCTNPLFFSGLIWTTLCHPSNLCVKALIPSVAIFGDRASKEVIKINEVIRVKARSDRVMSLQAEKRQCLSLSMHRGKVM